MPSSLNVCAASGSLWHGTGMPHPDHTGLCLTVTNSESSTGTNSEQHFRTKQQKQEYKSRTYLNAFEHVLFDKTGENVACADRRGNLYVLKLKLNRYSLIKRLGIQLTSMTFSTGRPSELLVSLKNNTIQCFNIENNTIVSNLYGRLHKSGEISNLSFHPADPSTCLSCSHDRVLIWDMLARQKLKTLASKNSNLTLARYTPSGRNVVTSVGNELYIWKSHDYGFLKKLAVHKLLLPHLHQIQTGAEKEFLTHFDISQDEEYLIGGGRTPYLFLWSFKNLSLMKIFALEQPPYNSTSSGSVKIKISPDATKAAVLTTLGRIVFIELGSLKILFEVKDVKTDFGDFDIDNQWTVATATSSDGSVRVYDLESIFRNTAKILDIQYNIANYQDSGNIKAGYPHAYEQAQNEDQPIPEQLTLEQSSTTLPTQRSFPRNNVRDMRWTSAFMSRTNPKQDPSQKVTLNMTSLKQLLLTFGEYPSKYRTLIWRFVLCLPENQTAYDVVDAKGTHPVLMDLHKRYPIDNGIMFRKVEKIASELVHISPVFGIVHYLPEIIFPFVKIFRDNMPAALEILLSFFQNWGKEWFHVYPEPPTRLLQQLDSLLTEYDPTLALHLSQTSSSKIYFWKPLTSLFTELLESDEWLKLFDHVFTMPPSFLYYFSVAYVSHFRASLLTKNQDSDFEFFFQNLNPCDVNKIIKLAYTIEKHVQERLRTQSVTNPVHDNILELLQVYEKYEPLLPTGSTYPIPTSKYPHNALNHQMVLHAKLLQQEEDLLVKRQLALNQKDGKQEDKLSERVKEYVDIQRQSIEEKLLLKESETEIRIRRLEEELEKEEQVPTTVSKETQTESKLEIIRPATPEKVDEQIQVDEIEELLKTSPTSPDRTVHFQEDDQYSQVRTELAKAHADRVKRKLERSQKRKEKDLLIQSQQEELLQLRNEYNKLLETRTKEMKENRSSREQPSTVRFSTEQIVQTEPIKKKEKKKKQEKKKRVSVSSAAEKKSEKKTSPVTRLSDSYRMSLLEQKQALSQAEQQMFQIEQLTNDFTTRNSTGTLSISPQRVSVSPVTISPETHFTQRPAPHAYSPVRSVSPVEPRSPVRSPEPHPSTTSPESPEQQSRTTSPESPKQSHSPVRRSQEEIEEEHKKRVQSIDIQTKFEQFMAKKQSQKISPTFQEPVTVERLSRDFQQRQSEPMRSSDPGKVQIPSDLGKTLRKSDPISELPSRLSQSAHLDDITPVSSLRRSPPNQTMRTSAILSSYERSEPTTVPERTDIDEIASYSSISSQELEKRVREVENVSTEDVSFDSSLLLQNNPSDTDDSFSFLSGSDIDSTDISSLLSMSDSEFSYNTKRTSAQGATTETESITTLETTVSSQFKLPLRGKQETPTTTTESVTLGSEDSSFISSVPSVDSAVSPASSIVSDFEGSNAGTTTTNTS